MMEIFTVFLCNAAAACPKKGAAHGGSKQMTVTAMFSKVSNKRKSAEGLTLENGVHVEEKNVKELTEVPSVGSEKTEAADVEMHFEKKVKLEDDDPKLTKLVSISYSFSKHRSFLSFGKLSGLCFDRINCQAMFSALCWIRWS
jgi:hypothetical protein